MLRAEDGIRDELALVFGAEQLIAVGIVGGCDVEIRPIGHELAQRRQKGLLCRVYLRAAGLGADPLAPEIAIKRDVVQYRRLRVMLIGRGKTVGGREVLAETLQGTQRIFAEMPDKGA